MDKDTGTIAALMIRFKEYRLPRAERMLEKVKGGATLSDEDMAWLDRVFKDARNTRPLVDRHPEYQRLAGMAVNLFSEIVSLAVENEKKTGGD